MHKERNTWIDFLSDSGELGSQIRSFDWALRDMGTVDDWPLTLKTILRLLLVSKQPMLVWWGPNLIQFYNDAYRKILGHNSKYPLELGQKARDYFGEKCTVIYPFIKKEHSVLPTLVEEELAPIFRDQNLEEVYWTSAYNPIQNDIGDIEGVLVTYNETIKRVVNRYQSFVQQINQVFIQVPIGICTLSGKNFIVESVNDKMLELWGKLDKAEVLGIPLFDVFPKTVNEDIREHLKQTFETGKPYVTLNEEIKIFKNGRLKQFYFKVICQPLLDENGTVVGIMGLADNITELVMKRKKTAENELRFRLAITSAELVTYQHNLLNDKVTGNKQFYKFSNLGYTSNKEKFIPKLHPEDLVKWESNYRAALVTEKLSHEARIVYSDNSIHWLKMYGKVIFDVLNNPIKILGIISDITQEKTLEKENNELLSKQIIEASRLQLFELVISHINEGILIIEISNNPCKDHKIIYCNDALAFIIGYTKTEIIGKTIDWINEVKADMVDRQKFKESIVNKESYEFEWMDYDVNKEVCWNRMCISPVIDTNGNYTHCIALIKDITVRKEKDKEITLAILQAQEAERFQIGAELHDNVNQILAGTLMNLGMAKNKMIKRQNVHLEKSIEYLRMGIEEIRRLSHWLAPVFHDEKSLLASFEKLLDDVNKNKQFKINFKNENITNSNIGDNIQINLYRILQEQMTNIIKYSGASVIEVALKKVNNEVHLTIDDNGVGMNTAQYQQGIGLNNIRKRVELLSGSFSLVSSLNNGCKIKVCIPLN